MYLNRIICLLLSFTAITGCTSYDDVVNADAYVKKCSLQQSLTTELDKYTELPL